MRRKTGALDPLLNFFPESGIRLEGLRRAKYDPVKERFGRIAFVM